MATLMAETEAGRAPSPTECTPAQRLTRSLLGYGLVAGPFYVMVVLAQAFLRPGFDLIRHDASLLSNGDFGWVQVVNFLLTGAMVIACAVGLRRALTGGRGATWAPILLGIYGVGLVGAGLFIADPMTGFPVGTPAGRPTTVTTHGILHIVFAAAGFIGLIACCMVMARRFAAENRPRWAAASIATGVIFLAGFFGLASGSSEPVLVLFFWVALVLAWTWLAAVALHHYRRAASSS